MGCGGVGGRRECPRVRQGNRASGGGLSGRTRDGSQTSRVQGGPTLPVSTGWVAVSGVGDRSFPYGSSPTGRSLGPGRVHRRSPTWWAWTTRRRVAPSVRSGVSVSLPKGESKDAPSPSTTPGPDHPSQIRSGGDRWSGTSVGLSWRRGRGWFGRDPPRFVHHLTGVLDQSSDLPLCLVDPPVFPMTPGPQVGPGVGFLVLNVK